MTQKNTLLVVGLITLFTASVNAAEELPTYQVDVVAIKERASSLAQQTQEIKKLLAGLKNNTNPSVKDCLKIGKYARELKQLEEDAEGLKQKNS
ncbi:MAG: hypothetical protein EBU90_17100 [Proteobacteria bacterium]|nr:hypothetical protein [Pseudomonadota bacterium]NBP16110.1 hypothetical protein [bacterium]